MGLVDLLIYIWLTFMVFHVGKYTVRAMHAKRVMKLKLTSK